MLWAKWVHGYIKLIQIVILALIAWLSILYFMIRKVDKE